MTEAALALSGLLDADREPTDREHADRSANDACRVDPGHIDPDEVERWVEALLFAASGPLSLDELALRLPAGSNASAALAALAERYAGRGIELDCVAGRFRFNTAPDLAFLMGELRAEPRRLSKAAMETLAIIAYHQPVTRAEVEAVRGVGLSRGTLDVLLEIGWVRMRGRRRSPGRPVTYGVSDAFLEHFGLASLADLPGAAEMKAAGLLSLDLPPDFTVPNPMRASVEDEDPFDPVEPSSPRFHQDYLDDAEPEP